MDKRPLLDASISLEDFRSFYWLKEELLVFCRQEGLKKTGSKIELAQQIEHYLMTGEKPKPTKRPLKKKKSTFDWNTEVLSLTTLITDNYKNTEHVRQFFQAEIGTTFKFNIRFMNWMKSNHGKTLNDAIIAWKTIKEAAKNNKGEKTIAPQFEYNTYIRDFLKDNPDKSRSTAIELWKIKRSRRGDNVYRQDDLNLIKET